MVQPAYTTDEMMIVAAARLLTNGAICFVGIGLPSTAANLARLSHAPDIVLIYESGPIGARPHVLPLSIGDGDLAETATTVVATPEIFQYWLQGGRIDVGFLGAAQIDRFGNLNTTMIGEYLHPTVRLPGAGGAPEIAAAAGKVFVMLPQTPRSFVATLDFITTVGFLDGGDARARLGLTGQGPAAIITDLAILEPALPTNELVVTYLHPGVTVEQVARATSWPLSFAPNVRETAPPTAEELSILRDLQRRTSAAHGLISRS